MLGALILHAIGHKIRLQPLTAAGRVHRSEMVLGAIALIGVIVIDVLQGLVIAMVASLLLHLYRSTRPHVAVLGLLPGGDRYGDVEVHEDASTTPGILVVRLDAPLYYANAASFRNRVRELVADAQPPVRAMVFDPEVQVELDVTSLEVVQELIEWLDRREIEVFVVRPHTRLLDLLDRSQALEVLGPNAIVDSVAAGVARARAVPRPAGN